MPWFSIFPLTPFQPCSGWSSVVNLTSRFMKGISDFALVVANFTRAHDPDDRLLKPKLGIFNSSFEPRKSYALRRRSSGSPRNSLER
jgi:hypothetical protein